MEGRDFLTVAQKLYGSADEAERRTAVSRAYYALFNHVKRSLEVKGVPFKKNAEAHDQVYRFLHNSTIEKAQIIASALSSLREVRNDADYNLQISGFDTINCSLHCKKAENSLCHFDDVDLVNLVNRICEYARIVKEPGIWP